MVQERTPIDATPPPASPLEMEQQEASASPSGGGGKLNLGGGGNSGMLRTGIIALIVTVAVLMLASLAGGVFFETPASSKKNFDNLLSVVNDAKTQSTSAANSVATQLAGLDTKINSAVTQGVNQATSSLTSQISGVNSKIGDVSSTVNSLNQQLGNVNSAINGVKTDVAAINAKVDTQNQKLADFDTRLKKLENAALPSTSPPTITSFTPLTGTSGAVVTITGTNFIGASSVTFGGTVAQTFTVVSATQITAVVGSGTTGAVGVSTAAGSTTYGTFTFTSPAPTISGFSPTSGPAGTSVVILGTNFVGVTSVTFGGTAATTFTVNSSTQITAIVGAGTTGVVGLTATGGTITNGTFTVTSQPPPTTGVTTTFIPNSFFGLPNTITLTVTNNSGKDIFGGQFSLTIQYLDATPTTANMVGLTSTEITWGTTGSISGMSVTIVGAAQGVFVLNGQSKIITVTVAPPTAGTQFRVTSATYSGYLQ